MRLRVPAGAAVLAYRPLELGYVNGKPLGVQRVSLIIQPPGAAQAAADGEGAGPLRVLGLFSLPEGAGALNLRRERYQLTRQLHRIATARRPRRAIELRVVQYGVTRERLADVLREAPGWDVLHVSGHGLPGGLVLEDPEGRADVISSDALVELLEWAAPRLKLVVLSSCDSAGTTLSEARHLLGLDLGLDPADATGKPEGERSEVKSLPAVAQTLTQRLGCAVVAMRYPVGDDFAIALGRELYAGLLDKRQPLPGALQQALPDALTAKPSPGTPPLSVATPALFGPRAADLALESPTGEPGTFSDVTSLAYVPDQPKRFVGRVGVMLRAGEALAEGRDDSDWSGVLLHGMAGGGKTAIALELAYGHAEQFEALVWHKAPDEGADITGALTAFALDLEYQLQQQLTEAAAPKLVHLAHDRDALARFAPQLTEFMQQHRVLVALDNLESLLTDRGDWRDDRWGILVNALAAHDGLSRVLMTSRTRPEGLDTRVRVEAVHALSLDEVLLLARELPNLGRLLNGTSGVDAHEGGELVQRTLRVVQGHPKLLELADGQAADPAELAARLEEADQAWAAGETQLIRFFEVGESAAAPGEFLRVLDGWTHTVAANLPEAAGLLFAVLCCLEEGDRTGYVVERNWGRIWRRVERPGYPPALDAPLAVLTSSGLVHVQDPQTDQPG